MHFLELGARTGCLLRRGLEDRIWEHAREEHLGGWELEKGYAPSWIWEHARVACLDGWD
jgi:hypothetical protein